jgi:hypothetical protein
MSSPAQEETCCRCLEVPYYFLGLDCAHHLCLTCAKSKTLRDFKDRTSGYLVCDICSRGTEILEDVVKALKEFTPSVGYSSTGEISSSTSETHSATDSKITTSTPANKKMNRPAKLNQRGPSIENMLLNPIKSASTISASAHRRHSCNDTDKVTSWRKIATENPPKHSNIPESLFEFEVTSHQCSTDDFVKATLNCIDFTNSIGASTEKQRSILSSVGN